MDRISQLHDELLLGILSSLPTAKDVMATMVLSKRWKFLWMFVPRLVYDGSYQDIDYGRFSTFVDRSLLLHKAPVLETLHFKLGKTCGSGDIPMLIRAADKHFVHELIIEIGTPSTNNTHATLPRSLFTCWKMLVTLKLKNAVLLDLVSSPFSLPSLKKLSLIYMKYPGDEFVNRLISSCPILEALVVKQILHDNVVMLSVRVPSLKSLVLHQKYKNHFKDKTHGFVLDTPSLECLDIVDFSRGFHIVENDMPNIVKANVDIFHRQTEQILGSITLAKYLHLCLPTSKNVSTYPAGSVFNRLVHLKLCTCETKWVKLLMSLLRDSPSLQVLELEQVHYPRAYQSRRCWDEPISSIPELLYSLETFKWESYDGTKEEEEVAAFVLRSAICLKKATIIPSKSIDDDTKLEMHKELSLLPRCSPVCQLAFR